MAKNKKRGLRFPIRRKPSREEILPKKVAREQLAWDVVFLRMRQSLEAAFPDPKKRFAYVITLIEKLGEGLTEEEKNQ